MSHTNDSILIVSRYLETSS